GEEKHYRIVGCDEFDPAKNWISIDSPVARALIGKSIDDEIKVETPSGLVILYINQIWYEK
ncbi:GreA/GreB family elongation factor, partial [Pasteurella multocida]